MILHLIHAGILVSDTQRSLHFYRDILKLEVSAARPAMAYAGAWLTVGQQQLHLIELPNPDSTTGRPPHGGHDRHLAFSVNNISDLVAALTHANIAFTISRSGRQALFCRDPDGNALEFVEVRTET